MRGENIHPVKHKSKSNNSSPQPPHQLKTHGVRFEEERKKNQMDGI
jgi:hypothetical protein